MSANITLRAPPRSKKSSKKTGRIKSSVEKGKVKRQRKSVIRKKKQAKKPSEAKPTKKPTKTKPLTVKRKRNAQHDPVTEKKKAKKKTTQMEVVRKDEKIRNPQSAEEVIYSDSDVEEVLGSSTLHQDSMPIPYYCPQFRVEKKKGYGNLRLNIRFESRNHCNCFPFLILRKVFVQD
ncbi:hypothetical protein MKW98_017273 [Papaver atlanticum]|uniref:Uncharacterized protein n=1 Tax=Papaver atlanticum TaxID=357466 RepID=A0AAD4X8J1_9MAGN|nr:hypothetical protein MKW98_017273 [Papaver atlanticum]